MPAEDSVHRLGLSGPQPCLAIHRRFWRDDIVAATQQVLTPASVGRLRLSRADAAGWTPAPGGLVRG